MFRFMNQFVLSKACLACDGCCRFIEEKSLWRPKITLEEKEQIAGLDSIDKVFPEGTVDESGRIKTVPCVYSYVCAFFNVEDHACGIYNRRPFECQLYPFLLVKIKDSFFLGVHMHCPYVQEYFDTQDYRRYVEYLRQFFAQDNVKDYLRKNYKIISDYSGGMDEIERVFPLDIKT